MNIALVSDAVEPFNKGGKEKRIYHLTKELAELGHNVDIYTMKWWTTPGKTYQANGITYHALSRLYPLYSGDRRSIKQGLLFGIACLKLLFYKFDVLDVDHMPFFPLYASKIVSVVKRKPLYATWHEVWGSEYWQEYLPGIKGRIASLIERGSIYLPHHIFAVSRHTEAQLRATLHYKGPLSLISNGIDYPTIASVPISSQTSDIIFVGRLLPHKQADVLIEAIAHLQQLHSEITCLIVGGGPEQPRLERLVSSLGLERNITITGFIESSNEVYGLMKASKIFVMPSTREGFGITVLEAFACDLLVVTSNHRDNAAQYLVPAGSGIVCEPSVAEITRAIETLLVQVGSGTTETPLDYDWKQLAAKISEAYIS